MNSTHLHLLLNHVAILGAIFSVMLLIAGIIRKNETIRTIALLGFVLSALSAIPVFLTGEPAEDSVKNLAGVIKATIEEHEESAELSMWLIEITGALSLVGLIFRNRSFVEKNSFFVPLLLIGLGTAGSIAYTGYVGGKIRHTEIANGSTVQGIDKGGENGEQNEKVDKD